MKSQPNNDLKKQFDRDFRNAEKMRKAEELQNPFGALAFIRNGEVVHKMRIGWN